ncbi:sigma-54-dependent transcriptional regulator [Sphingomonas sp. CLY1604]|uniref:sigma-54-dependent transcriptional regulator n=1 Tax=Sphingomonas sp. CLY1604 TaxID=3457786 RepID=UPI003FD85A57
MDKRFFQKADDPVRPRSDGPSTNGRPAGSSSALSILLIDDNPHVAESLGLAVRLAGHALERAADPEEALSRLAVGRYDAILLDMNYAAGRTGGEEGMALLGRILADDPGARVVVITAHSGIRIAVEAMRAGARDFVMKPWRNADLLARLERAAAPATAAPMPLPVDPRPQADALRLIGDSDGIVRARDLIRRVGPTLAGVLVTGASGTGRTLVAAAIHAASPHAEQPMIRVDLRDAPAWQRLDDASGTLLLRHLSALDAVEQARLLDRLPDAARIIAIADDAAAIHPALARRVAAVEIALPPLASRGDDALLLARHFVRIAAERHGRPVPQLTPSAEAAVLRAPWPDEVRGLAAAVERAVLLGDGGVIDTALLLPPAPAPAVPAATAPSRFDLEENERAVIAAALRQHHHNVTHAANALGLSRGALYRRMERYGF